jgi:RNA polymerase sigma factor (sigma-70 family)
LALPRSGSSDAELVALALAGDRASFGKLVERHQGRLRGRLRRLAGGDRALADDLAQEAFVRAYQLLGTYRGEAAFGTWLQAIGYRCFATEMRRRSPEISVGDEPQVEMSTARIELEAALARLPWEERAALVTTYARDMSHEEAARALGWPLGTLKTRVASAKERLRLTFADRMEDCGDG